MTPQVEFETAGEGGVPHVTTAQPLNVTTSSADLGGHVTEQGGSAVVCRGFARQAGMSPPMENMLS
jgi:hypothetical protein